MLKRVSILEATVRDGGYMVDHHYSRVDLATLVGGLARAGLPLIEVGHGNGVGSQWFKDPKLRATSLPLVGDDGHAEVALRVTQQARVGVIFTAGRRFVPIEYIDHIADLGFAFIRQINRRRGGTRCSPICRNATTSPKVTWREDRHPIESITIRKACASAARASMAV